MAVRKNAASMGPPEISKFINALLALKKEPTVTASGTATNIYDQFVSIHDGVMSKRLRTGGSNINGGHSGPAFCSWHREYILRFEKALQDISGDPNMFLPYWKWDSVNTSDTDLIFVDDFMGPRERITSGFFAEVPDPNVNPDGWKINPALDTGNGTTLTRNSFSVNSRIASDGRNSLLQTEFAGPGRFRSLLESAHNSIHVAVGGHMLTMTSPNDPIFFMHHANVDRLWAQWQLTHPGDGNYPSTHDRYGHALTDLMWPWDGGESESNRPLAQNFLPPIITDRRMPRDVLDIESLGYTYDDAVGSSGWSNSEPDSTRELQATSTPSSGIDLLWQSPLWDGGLPIGYVIERGTSASNLSIIVANTNSTSTTYSDTGLSGTTQYFYRVSAINAAGTGKSSNIANATTSITDPSGSSLNPPTNFDAVNPTANSIDLVWGSPNGGTSHTGYVIRRRLQNTGSFVEIARPSYADTSFPDTGLLSQTTYQYEIRSVDANNNESAPETYSETTTGRCFVVTATYGTELVPQTQSAHEFYFDVVRESKLKKPFEKFLQIYYKVSPPIANLMDHNKSFKYFMKYTVVIPFLVFSRVAAFLVGLRKNWNKKIE